MESRHIKMDYEEALSAKKQLLITELNLLRAIKAIKAYKIYRKKELAMKLKLKSETDYLKSKLNVIENSFPHQEFKEDKVRSSIEKEMKKESNSIERELEEIKQKLRKLEAQ